MQPEVLVLPGPAGKYAELKARGAPPEVMAAVVGAELASRAQGAAYNQLHVPAWQHNTSFMLPSWRSALAALDCEEFDGAGGHALCVPAVLACMRTAEASSGPAHWLTVHLHPVPRAYTEDSEMFASCVRKAVARAATHKVPKVRAHVRRWQAHPGRCKGALRFLAAAPAGGGQLEAQALGGGDSHPGGGCGLDAGWQPASDLWSAAPKAAAAAAVHRTPQGSSRPLCTGACWKPSQTLARAQPCHCDRC